jgi:hypothetical protein
MGLMHVACNGMHAGTAAAGTASVDAAEWQNIHACTLCAQETWHLKVVLQATEFKQDNGMPRKECVVLCLTGHAVLQLLLLLT